MSLPFGARLRARPKVVDPKLHDFVQLLHRSPPPPQPPRELLRRSAKYAAGALIVAAVGALLWFPWPGLGSFFKAPAAPAEAPVSPAGVATTAPAFVAPATSTMPEPISAAHAEPPRAVPPPAPPAPEADAGSTALPPQDAARVVVASPPLPPMPSLPLPSEVAMAVPAPPPAPSAPAAATVQPVSAAVPAWIRYAVAAPARNGRPRIAVVIDDLGLDRARTARTIALPAPLTLAFLPYAMELGSQTEAARKAGHELLVHIPMEPIGRNNDAGPSPLEIGLSAEAVLQRLRWDLSRFDGYVGIDNHMGSRFTADAEALQPVMQELRERGLLFLDSRTVPHSAGVSVAARYGVPHAGRDVFLDDEIASTAIEARLAELERVARHGGSAIAIGHPHDATLDALKTWLRDAPSKGFVLVPVSTIVKERAGEG
jgi:polysaccharide deacetylase 2 family uncharacterized protein YibQ